MKGMLLRNMTGKRMPDPRVCWEISIFNPQFLRDF